MIVIVTWEEDISARLVAEALGRLGREDIFWIDLERAFENLSLVWHAGRAGSTWTLRARGGSELCLVPQEISAVYWRRVARRLDSPMMGLPTSANLDQYEIFWSLRWLLESLPAQLFPLGHPEAHSRAENKHRQIAAALETGFAIPESCHSNDIPSLREFISMQEEIAIKAMRMPGVTRSGNHEEARHIACKSFTPSFLLDKLQALERTQLFCQQAIQRAHDLRIMVFPRETIAVEIDTSSLPGNKLDWREESFKIAHRIVPVDPGFDRQLRHYLALMNLTTGYFDFAVPAVGPPVFFECNTNAQWGWIQQITGHPISEVIARELANPTRQSHLLL